MSRSSQRLPGLLASSALCLVGIAACREEVTVRESVQDPTLPARFAVRGRVEDPWALTYRLEPAQGPLDEQAFRDAIERALQAWRATGVVDFRPAPTGEQASFSLAWRRGKHDRCKPFGRDPSVAHSGPLRHGSFVHFDADRSWSVDGRSGESLFQAALHEIGHQLGLGHSADSEAVLYADTHSDELGRSDLAGLHSLYGGYHDGPGDLRISSLSESAASSAPLAHTLRRVAPAERTAFGLFDTDGDGDEEVVVWRTDIEGFGVFKAYDFAVGPLLVRSVGPLLGVVPHGSRPSFLITPEGRRLMICSLPGGEVQVREFDQLGRPLIEIEEQSELRLLEQADPREAACEECEGDLDGDGSLERVVRRRS